MLKSNNEDTSLGSTIGREKRSWGNSRNGADVNDGSLVLCQHSRQGKFGHVGGGLNIDLQLLFSISGILIHVFSMFTVAIP